MGIVYVTLPLAISRDREKVSRAWSVVLHDMREDVVFNVNEGHRTLARQREFYRAYLAGTGNLAAYPSPFAPHIRTGRLDHAIDVSDDVAVFSWLSRHDLQPARTVTGESWHIECPAWALLAYYARHKAQLTVGGVGRVRTKTANVLLRRRRLRRAEGATGRGPRWRRLNRAVQRSQEAVARYRNRAKSGRVRRILNRVLRDRDGRL